MSTINVAPKPGKIKYTYKKIIDGKDTYGYKCWKEYFTDEDTKECVAIERKKLIKFNGEKVVFYSNSALKKMSKKERDSVKLKSKN